MKTGRGFTLIEVTMGLGILSVVVLMAMGGIDFILKVRKKSTNRDDIETFVQKLSHYLKDEQRCMDHFVNRNLPVNAEDLVIVNYAGGGLTSNPRGNPDPTEPMRLRGSPDVNLASRLNERVTIRRFTWVNKQELISTYNYGSMFLNKQTAQFTITFDIFENNVTEQRTRTFDVPFITAAPPNNNRIVRCSTDLRIGELCALTNKVWNPRFGQCMRACAPDCPFDPNLRDCKSFGGYVEVRPRRCDLVRPTDPRVYDVNWTRANPIFDPPPPFPDTAATRAAIMARLRCPPLPTPAVPALGILPQAVDRLVGVQNIPGNRCAIYHLCERCD